MFHTSATQAARKAAPAIRIGPMKCNAKRFIEILTQSGRNHTTGLGPDTERKDLSRTLVADTIDQRIQKASRLTRLNDQAGNQEMLSKAL